MVLSVFVRNNEYEDSEMAFFYYSVYYIYSVSFNANGGSTNVLSKDIKTNEPIGELPIPTKENYLFDGWYMDQNWEKKITPDSILDISENITLYAKWDIILYEVLFETNGGNFIDSLFLPCGSIINDPSNPTKNGYEFLGWYEDIELTRKFDFNRTISQNIILYAKWNEKLYVVSFETNGGSLIDSMKLSYGSIIKEPSQPIKANYEFLGWYEDIKLIKKFTFGQSITNNITLYAKWNLITATNDEISQTYEDVIISHEESSTEMNNQNPNNSKNKNKGLIIGIVVGCISFLVVISVIIIVIVIKQRNRDQSDKETDEIDDYF